MTATTTFIVLRVLEGNDGIELVPLQEVLVPHLHLLTTAWMALWCTTVMVLLYMLYLVYRNQK